MVRGRPAKKRVSPHVVNTTDGGEMHLDARQQERIRKALTLLLGPRTDTETRLRAEKLLARQGPALLPLLLATLSSYPEINSPMWPDWPPQYEHSSHLLAYLSEQSGQRLDVLLRHPSVAPPVGPVLWTSVMEATSLFPDEDYEEALCDGLAAPWLTVRSAAATALAIRATRVTLRETTIEVLQKQLSEEEMLPLRLTMASALLRCGAPAGARELIDFLNPVIPEDIRKAAAFLLATEPPSSLPTSERSRLISHLLHALQDRDIDLARSAAHALSGVARPSVLPALSQLLSSRHSEQQITALMALEEMAQSNAMRRMIRYYGIPSRIAPLLSSQDVELRRQASYTFAACGGDYAMAVLGTMVLNLNHPGHQEAIEGLRLLRGSLRSPIRGNLIRWLLHTLTYSSEEGQVTALDSLIYLLWRARSRGYKQARCELSYEIIQDGTVFYLLNNPSAWVRQRSLELLSLIDYQVRSLEYLPNYILRLLHKDGDSGVRASAAHVCEQLDARWAIPDLIETLLDPDPSVASAALHALGRLATPEDSIPLYVMRELVSSKGKSKKRFWLGQEAAIILKRWHVRQHPL